MNDSINLNDSQAHLRRDRSKNMQSVLSLSRIGNELLQGESRLKDSIALSPRENQKLLEFIGEKKKAPSKSKGPEFYPKDTEEGDDTKENVENQSNNTLLINTGKDSLLMTLGNDELNWLLKELATGNQDINSGVVSDTIADWEKNINEGYDQDQMEPKGDEDSYIELENEILKQMNLSTN